MSQTVPAALLFPQVVSVFPVVGIIGTSYHLTGADVGLWLRTANAAPVTVTLDPDPDAAFGAWAMLYLQKGGAGNVTLVAGPGVTIQSSQPLVLNEQFTRLELKRTDVNVWTATVIGNVAAGATNFLQLTDTPAAYAGAATQLVRVNAGESGLEFQGRATTPLRYDLEMPGGSIAAAATTDIGSVLTATGGPSVLAMKIQITGAGGPITSLGTAANRFRLLVFAGVVTLVHNAVSLMLQGGANIVTAAGDTAIATSDSAGNWRVRQYTRAADGVDFVSKVQAALQTMIGPLRTPGGVGGGFQVGATGEIGTDADGNLLFYGPNASAAKLVRMSTGYYPAVGGVATVINGAIADVTRFAGVAVMPSFQVVSAGAAASILFGRYSANALEPRFLGLKSRAAVVGGRAAIVANDYLLTISGAGDDGTNPVNGANLRMQATAIGAGVITADLVTELSNASAVPVEVSRWIGASGALAMGGASNLVIDGSRILRPRSYTIATLPAVPATGIIHCSDLGGGAGLLASDGTRWYRDKGGFATIASDAAAAFSWAYLTNAHTIFLNLPTTAARAVALGTTNVPSGTRLRFVRTAASTGGFAWNIGTGPLKNVVAGSWAEFEFDGTAWQNVGTGSL